MSFGVAVGVDVPVFARLAPVLHGRGHEQGDEGLETLGTQGVPGGLVRGEVLPVGVGDVVGSNAVFDVQAGYEKVGARDKGNVAHAVVELHRAVAVGHAQPEAGVVARHAVYVARDAGSALDVLICARPLVYAARDRAHVVAAQRGVGVLPGLRVHPPVIDEKGRHVRADARLRSLRHRLGRDIDAVLLRGWNHDAVDRRGRCS